MRHNEVALNMLFTDLAGNGMKHLCIRLLALASLAERNKG